ncbi:MAG: DNA internalization-related competence protein ComEC/Rec2 [Pseudodesulfovibrio sp.]|uniref:DNA internalization-related competence protein ComEC/Rec2 n=1 Tax=Pseudodesulfovibrio sp. TaxID=2035812 RepID=UPI003D0DD2FE
MRNACWTYAPAMPGLLPWQTYVLAFGAGVYGVRYPAGAAGALAVLCVADFVLRGRDCRVPLLAVVLCAVFGFAYGTQRTPDGVAEVPGWMEARQPVLLSGVVVSAEPRPDHRLRVILEQVRCEADGAVTDLPGRLTWSERDTEYRPLPGQTLRALARVQPVRNFGDPGTWDYEWYWRRQGVLWRAWPTGRAGPEWGVRPEGALAGLKAALRGQVAGLLPDTRGGAMVLALTTGDRSELDQATMDATRSAGLAHTLALSGLHVGFVAAMGYFLALLAGWCRPPLLLRVPRPRLAVLFGAPLVLIYAWLGQPSASLVRASVMFGFWGLLLLQGRGRVLLDGLFFALAAILFISPLSVFDLSLQMSLAAVAGIALLYPLFRSLFAGGGPLVLRVGRWALGVLAVSVSATLGILPLSVWYFGAFAPNLLLNLVWLPALGFAVMPLGFLGMALAPLSGSAAGLLLSTSAAVADKLLWALDAVRGAGLTPVWATLRPLWPESLGFALLLVLAVLSLRGRRVSAGLAGLGLALLVLPQAWVMGLDSRDQVSLAMLDVGLGQSLVVSLPGGHRWLVDAGGGSQTFDLGEAVVGPSLTLGRPPRLDGIFLSHPDVDHSHGVPFLIERFSVGALYTNGMLPSGLTGERLRPALAARGLVPIRLSAGDAVELGSGTRVAVLHPGEGFSARRANERSLVLRLERAGRHLALLPGDVERSGVRALLDSGSDLSAEVLVLPHHGSRVSFDPDFYAAVSPRVVLVSNGYLNRYGFPDPGVAAAARAAGGAVYTTARNGRVVCTWAGPEGESIVDMLY